MCIAWFTSSTTYSRTLSPDGRFEIIRGSHEVLLDSYAAIWIAPVGEQNSDAWHRLTPWVDGRIWTEWESDHRLVVHDDSQTGDGFKPKRFQKWRDVEIEVVFPARFTRTVSPDGRYVVLEGSQCIDDVPQRAVWIAPAGTRFEPHPTNVAQTPPQDWHQIIGWERGNSMVKWLHGHVALSLYAGADPTRTLYNWRDVTIFVPRD